MNPGLYQIKIIICANFLLRCSATNSGESTPYEANNISRDESETEIDELFRYDGGHIALDYGTGTFLTSG